LSAWPFSLADGHLGKRGHDRVADCRSPQPGALHLRARQVEVAEIGAAQVGTTEVRSVGKAIGEIGATEVSATQARPGERHHPRLSARGWRE